ncbi:MAG: hypothetical protein WCS28_03450 [Thiomicrospira sp.]|jgi:hypothetical protein
MIHIFRIFNNPGADYLEFHDKHHVIKDFNEQKDQNRFNWQIMPTRKALIEEKRLTQQRTLQVMHDLGDQKVVKVVINGAINWYSPSHAHGIPSEYQVALDFFTYQCKFYKVTSRHHEVFKVLRDPRFKSLHQEIVDRILKRVKDTRCHIRLDRYLDMNLNKLPHYGVKLDKVDGTYIDIQNTLRENQPNCPLFSDFMLRLLDVCIEKEQELLGRNFSHSKQIKRA